MNDINIWLKWVNMFHTFTYFSMNNYQYGFYSKVVQGDFLFSDLFQNVIRLISKDHINKRNKNK